MLRLAFANVDTGTELVPSYFEYKLSDNSAVKLLSIIKLQNMKAIHNNGAEAKDRY